MEALSQQVCSLRFQHHIMHILKGILPIACYFDEIETYNKGSLPRLKFIINFIHCQSSLKLKHIQCTPTYYSTQYMIVNIH